MSHNVPYNRWKAREFIIARTAGVPLSYSGLTMYFKILMHEADSSKGYVH